MRVVVDASVAVKWLVAEEDSDAANRLLTDGDDLYAPRLMVSPCPIILSLTMFLSLCTCPFPLFLPLYFCPRPSVLYACPVTLSLSLSLAIFLSVSAPLSELLFPCQCVSILFPFSHLLHVPVLLLLCCILSDLHACMQKFGEVKRGLKCKFGVNNKTSQYITRFRIQVTIHLHSN